MHSNNVLHTYAHAIFNKNLCLQCSGAQPHKLVSGPVQLHQHQKAPSHPFSEVASNDYIENLPGSLRHHDYMTPSNPNPLSPMWTPLPELDIHEQTPSPPHTPPRRTLGIDVLSALPCWLEHIRQPPHCPSNTYGECHDPVQQIKEIKQAATWKDLTSWSTPSVPETPSVPGVMPPSPTPSEDNVECIVWEGGDTMVSYLCTKAVPLSKKASKPNYHEWFYRDLLHLPESEYKQWFKACKVELDMQKQHKVFEVSDCSSGRKVIKNQWVFNEKSDGHKHAWLVMKGFPQAKDLCFDQISSPVVHFETVWCMPAPATLENWHISGLNVQFTYLYGKLDEEIYMEFPEGFAPPHLKNKVLRLLHALYGLKQAGLAWWNELNESMKELGFEWLKTDTSLFIYKEKNWIIIVIIHVDNTLFVAPQKP